MDADFPTGAAGERYIKKMKKIKFLKYVATALLVSYSTGSVALPVEDFGEWIRTVQVSAQLKDQMSTLLQQYQTLQDQYSQMKQQYSASTGNYGWGNWNNTQDILQKERQWAAGDWSSALKGMAGGNPARYQELLQEYETAHETMATNQFQNGSDTHLAASYQNEVETNEASATTATYEFNDINQHLNTLYQLGQQIENASSNSDLKAAIDLNSRIQLEIAYIAIEELRMQTILNQQMAEMQSARITAENEASTYNQAGENP